MSATTTSELKVTRKNGNWFTTIGGQEYGVDWADEIFEREWDYTHQGVAGKVIFLDVHGGDDPYFSSQKDADKQLMRSLTLRFEHDFIRYMYAFQEGNDEEINLGEILVAKEA